MSYPLAAELDPSPTSIGETTEVEACVLDGVSPVALLVWLTLLSDPGLEDDAESSSSSTRKETAGFLLFLLWIVFTEPSCSKSKVFSCRLFLVSSSASAERLKVFSHHGALPNFALSLSAISAGV